MPCDAARAARDSVFWWLADPSYLIPGNDRRTEHLARGVGNHVLALYRGAATSIDGVIWFAGAVPHADSIGRFADHEAEFARTLGPWRWHRELSRFGMPDSFESLPDVDISAGWAIREGRGRGATTGTPNPTARSTIRAGARFFADCPRGFEPRELLITDLRPDLGVRPREGAANAGLYPPVVFTGYRWARPLWINCVRAHNSTALYQLTPEWPVTRHVLDTAVIIGIGAEGLNGGLPYREQYSPPYGPVSEIRRFQLARFPRGDSMLLVGTVAPSGRIARTVVPHPKSGPWRVGLIAASVVPPKSTRDVTIAEIRPDSLVSRYQLSVVLPARSILAGFEILTPDTTGLARMRATLPLSPWLTGATRISDPLLLSLPTGANLPRGVTLDSLLQFVMASTVINAGQNLGLYWEIQLGEGAPPGVDLDLTLSVERTDRTPGGLGAFLRSLFGRGRGTQLTSWKDSPAERGTAPGSRITGAVNVGTAQLEPGEYRLTLRAALSGAAPVLSMREFSIVKAGAQPM
jgi:hypothetical protein